MMASPSLVIGPNEEIITATNYRRYVDPIVDGTRRVRGLRPRDYQRVPVGHYAFAKPFDIPLIDESEWEDRLAENIRQKAILSLIRDQGNFGKSIPSCDQDGIGYCWCHSGRNGAVILRAVMNEPYEDLSAFMVGCIIKNFRNQGGFGSQGIEFIAEKGICTTEHWPNQSMDRSNLTDAMYKDALRNRVTEWMDLTPRSKAQLVTCLLLGIPVVVDYNWWGHSVLAIDLVSLKPFRIRIWNSWSDQWSERGMGILEGSRAIPDGAIAPRVMTIGNNGKLTHPVFPIAI